MASLELCFQELHLLVKLDPCISWGRPHPEVLRRPNAGARDQTGLAACKALHINPLSLCPLEIIFLKYFSQSVTGLLYLSSSFLQKFVY